MRLASGSTVGPYRILGPIGAGGMGEVYKARDPRLDRIVAIKIAQDRFTERFEREARAVAALNHPHICQLYDVGPDYLVMEYIEGKPLSSPLPLEEALRLGAQIADALDAAHQKGILHRDLKPANILAGKAGIKLLDFGLAKTFVAGADAETAATAAMTQVGAVVGTLSYMSPERLKGKEGGPESDIFALGCVLYEMIAGKPAFEGSNPATLIAAILEKQPPRITAQSPGTPPSIERLLDVCLAKDPEARWRCAADLRRELEWLAADLRSPQPARVVRTRPRFYWIALLPLLVLAGFGLARWLVRPRSVSYDALPLTSYPGAEARPALSPDGNLIAFSWTGPDYGPPQVCVKQLDGSEPLVLSHGDFRNDGITWSPDGHQVAFLQIRAGSASVIVVPALGGPERIVASAEGSSYPLGLSVCWFGGARAILTGGFKSGSESGLRSFSLDNGAQTVLTHPPSGSWDAYPKLSPEGRLLAFVRRPQVRGGESEIYLQNLSEGQRPEGAPRRICVLSDIRGLDWMPDGGSLIVSALRNGAQRLTRVLVSSGKVEPFPGAPAGSTEVSISAAARRMAITVEEHDIDIWRLAGPAWPVSAPIPQPERLIASTADDVSPEYSSDGRRIVFESGRTGNQEIWTADAEGHNAVQLTNFGGPPVGSPRWSPDGMKVVFDSRKFGPTDVFVIPASGGSPERLTNDPSDHVRPIWSSDGHWIFFCGNRTGRDEIFKMPAGGGDPIQLTRDGGSNPRRFASDTWIYYFGPEKSIYRIRESGGEAEKLTQAPAVDRWSPTAQGIVLYAYPLLELFRTAAGLRSVLRQLPPVSPREFRTGMFTVSPDERWILIPLTTMDRSDLMLIENLR